jgi:hypothetical protein
MFKYIVFGYLDPGSGSLVLQVIIGGLAASFLAIKTFWGRIKAFFAGKKDSEKKP